MSFLTVWLSIFPYTLVFSISFAAAYTGGSQRLCEDGSVRISNVGDSGQIYADLTTNDASYDNPCILRMESCSACQIQINPEPTKDFEFFCRTHNLQNTFCSLGCDYLHIFDMYYMNESSTAQYYTKWSDFTQPFVSQSSSVFIMLCHGNSGRYNFSLTYRTIKKQKDITGTSNDKNLDSGVILSPFFPRGYYLNHEVYEYIITGLRNDDRILLIFDDWHLHSSSGIYYEEDTEAGTFEGTSLRPSYLTVSNRLRFVFHTGEALPPTFGRHFMGFKASYSFHSSSSIVVHKPITSCKGSGYFLSDLGGHIEFTHSSVQKQLYDCVWVVKKHPHYNNIYLKVITLKMIGFGRSGRLVIRSGLTSDGKVKANVSVYDDVKTMQPLYDPEGFYIRLTATLSSSDQVQLAYASYRDNLNCHREPGMFECDSRKCISSTLSCDGYDHCGDNSDENKACGVYTPPWDQSYQYTITIGVIVPMVISVFLVMVICLLFVLIRRCRRQRLENARSPDRIRTLSEDVSPTRGGNRRRRRHRRRMFNASTDRENPPTYDEAIQSPPSWYLNVGFSNPADPNLPQPPPYTELAEGQPAINQAAGSPASSHSSQSEVTLDSRRHSVSSSSSEGGFRDWNEHESDTEGRLGRLGRHVSSSEESDEEEQTRRTRIPTRLTAENNQDGIQTGSTTNVTSQNVSENNRRKGKSHNDTQGDKNKGKEKSVKDKNTSLDNVVDSSNIELDGGNKVGTEVKQGHSNTVGRKSNGETNIRYTADVPSSSPATVSPIVPRVQNISDNEPNHQPRNQAHAGVRPNDGNRFDEIQNISRPSLSNQRGISRSEGHLAQIHGNPTRGPGHNEHGTRRSLASQILPEECLSNLVVDVDTNEIRVVYNGADSTGESRRPYNGSSSRQSPQHYSMQNMVQVRPDNQSNASESRNVNNSSRGRSDYYTNVNNSSRVPYDNRNASSLSPVRTRSDAPVRSSDRSGDVNMADRRGTRQSSPDVRNDTQAQGMERSTSVNYIPLFLDGNPDEDIYV